MRRSLILCPTAAGVLLGVAVFTNSPLLSQERPPESEPTVPSHPIPVRQIPAKPAVARPAATPKAAIVKDVPRDEAPPKSATGKVAATALDEVAKTVVRSVTEIADEAAIRATDAEFAEAYARGDAQAAAEHFTDAAEYVDERGQVFEGRPAIQEALTAFFAENPVCHLEIEVGSIRFIGPGLAIEDGVTKLSRAEKDATVESPYTAIHVKVEGGWRVASIRDHAPKDRRQHRSQLEQLDWLVGEWVDEGDESLVTFSCVAADNSNFLMRKFSILVAGQEAMSGTQRIGWDPLTSQLRMWIFDSEGGYGEGLWHRIEGEWVLKLNGVTADGEPTSSTSIYTPINGHTMTWQSVDHEIAGVQLPDSEIVTLVRQAPSPKVVVDEK
jgi:uncharacterized protein (TIGR02246 family)